MWHSLQMLLNTIPQTRLQRLIEDGIFGRRTLERVVEFQKNAKLVADGVIGSQSWAMLDQSTQFLLPPGKTPGTLGAWRSEPFREAVLRAALGETLPVCKVSDFLSQTPEQSVNAPPPLGKTPTKTPEGWRFGWQRLKQNYDPMVVGVGSNY